MCVEAGEGGGWELHGVAHVTSIVCNAGCKFLSL